MNRLLVLGIFITLALNFVLGCGSSGSGGAGSTAPSGTLDSTFGTGGKKQLSFDDFGADGSYMKHSKLLSDGKILIVSTDGNNPPQYSLRRLQADGSVDSTFGVSGAVPWGVAGTDCIDQILVQSDGKIILVGTHGGQFLVARLTSDGSSDATFGTAGTFIFNVNGEAIPPTGAASICSATLQSDGKIIFTAGILDPADPSYPTSYATELALARITTSGALDNTFGTAGVVATQVGVVDVATGAPTFSSPYTTVLQADGKILVGISATDAAGIGVGVARFTSSGAIDSSFGSSGVYLMNKPGTTSPGDAYVLVRSNNKIIVADTEVSSCGNNCGYIYQINSDGTLDTSFGSSGVFSFMPSGFVQTGIASVTEDSSGRLVFTGFAMATISSAPIAAVGRITSSGAVDSTFGTSGALTFSINSISDQMLDVFIQSDGKILVTGVTEKTSSPFTEAAVLARVNP